MALGESFCLSEPQFSGGTLTVPLSGPCGGEVYIVSHLTQSWAQHGWKRVPQAGVLCSPEEQAEGLRKGQEDSFAGSRATAGLKV